MKFDKIINNVMYSDKIINSRYMYSAGVNREDVFFLLFPVQFRSWKLSAGLGLPYEFMYLQYRYDKSRKVAHNKKNNFCTAG